MSKTFVTSDHHFGHPNILRFKRADDTPLRDFHTYEDMEAHMINCWNEVVSPEDKVYHLGDFAMHKRYIKVADRLNGRKTLIMGNHDIFNTSEYTPYFDNVRAYKVLNTKNDGRIILSHIPIHVDCLARFGLNVHGHLHANNMPDKRYVNVSVEQTNYYPIDIQTFLN